ncbi:MAG: hypothetical protein LWX02_13580, partial [Deltaproteobacteria bacterium]|jgi:hypothetical protein|nr:hypothetical protein [Deltaproteobacteria bacterium]
MFDNNNLSLIPINRTVAKGSKINFEVVTPIKMDKASNRASSTMSARIRMRQYFGVLMTGIRMRWSSVRVAPPKSLKKGN